MSDNQKPEPPHGSKGPRKEPDENFDWRRAGRTLAFWIFLILVVIIISTIFGPNQDEAGLVDYSKYRQYLENDRFTEAVITEREFRGKLRSPDEKGREQVKTVLPFVNDQMVQHWEEKGLKIEFREEATNWIGMLLTSILPWVILIGLWLFFMRRMTQGASRGIFTFGKSKAKLMTEERSKVTFDDVAGGEEAKEELQEIIQFLKDPKKFQRLGGRIPKGALLVGPPGTGKTLLAKAIAGEAGVPFFSMSGADFVEMFVGVGASRVRDLFEQGKRHAPCIIFIDELDAVGRQRGAGLGGGHDEREQTLNQLLVEMDGFESNEGVILIAATNRPDVLDPALLRPGRFDRQIVVDRPDVRGREGILKVHTKNIPLASDVDLKVLAKGTPGLSGADLANLVNEAALLAARRNGTKVTQRDFEDAKDKVMMGTERRSMLISDEEKKLTAYHEAGHVLVAKLTPGSDPVHKVTIIPRGRALGTTHYLPIDEKHSWNKHYIEDKMVHLMGGRAAEKLVFEDYTNGAASDIKQATEIARRMVCEWGMSEKIGPLALGGRDQEVFLGRDFTQQKDYSEATALEIDREIKRFVTQSQNQAVDLISNNMDKLHSLSQALLEREILDGEEIEMVMEGRELPKLERPTLSEEEELRQRASRDGGGRPDAKKSEAKEEEAGAPDRTDDDRLREVDEVLKRMKDGGKRDQAAGGEGSGEKDSSGGERSPRGNRSRGNRRRDSDS
ncbi:MAG: ATP-dependent zinc metalloprotease FtsH [Calditrichaeota bacterium]|nr:ATP-dependent zinc metalloprotease FtsH [Calditrichota bacterium]